MERERNREEETERDRDKEMVRMIEIELDGVVERGRANEREVVGERVRELMKGRERGGECDQAAIVLPVAEQRLITRWRTATLRECH